MRHASSSGLVSRLLRRRLAFALLGWIRACSLGERCGLLVGRDFVRFLEPLLEVLDALPQSLADVGDPPSAEQQERTEGDDQNLGHPYPTQGLRAPRPGPSSALSG